MDTLWIIANKFSTTIDHLVKLNNPSNSNVIHVG
ncbi:LysM peptidoglycan-binding domain-containing protein [Serpentinicella alkaliphila]|nr:LysM peptidoglycan-binding domain-containing protein [Serpentinicella alkaliphila]